MNKSFSKAKLPIAARKVNKFSIPSSHITTAGFMRFFPAYYRILPKRTSLKVHHDTFVRTNPLDKPFYGNVSMYNRAFFVPYRVVWEPFQDFYNDVPHNTPDGTKLLSLVPRISLGDLVDALTDSSFAYVSDSSAFDLYFNGTTYSFNSRGRAAYSLLEALGYKIFVTKHQFDYSALNLLCLAKVYLDWYFPAAYAHYGLPAFMDGIFQRQDTYYLTRNEIVRILTLIMYVSYKDDFYSSVWDNPIGPNTGAGSTDFAIPDITRVYPLDSHGVAYSQSGISQDANGTPRPFLARSQDSPENPYISYGLTSQYADSSLKALTSYIRRHQLAGSRSLERALAQYGVMLDAEKLKRCYYLGSDDFDLHVADVMSTAETQDASLGSYAGKAIASSAKDFDVYTDEEGVFFIINSIVPDICYFQGIDPHLRMLSKLDHYTPEFDGLGPAAVSASELLLSTPDDSSLVFNDYAVDAVFGFAPRYYQYKIPYNKLTGTFICQSRNTDFKSWYISRNLSIPSSPSLFKHNLEFELGSDADQYNNVFLSVMDDPEDPFYVIHRDNAVLESPMRHLYDTVVFDEDENNQKVTTEPNGVKLN